MSKLRGFELRAKLAEVGVSRYIRAYIQITIWLSTDRYFKLITAMDLRSSNSIRKIQQMKLGVSFFVEHQIFERRRGLVERQIRNLGFPSSNMIII